MYSIELSDKQLTYIILALDSYAQELREDEEDPGPSMADSFFVVDLTKKLRDFKERK